MQTSSFHGAAVFKRTYTLQPARAVGFCGMKKSLASREGQPPLRTSHLSVSPPFWSWDFCKELVFVEERPGLIGQTRQREKDNFDILDIEVLC